MFPYNKGNKHMNSFLFYFILAVSMQKCLGKHSCISSTFFIAVLNCNCCFHDPWLGWNFACQKLSIIIIDTYVIFSLLLNSCNNAYDFFRFVSPHIIKMLNYTEYYALKLYCIKGAWVWEKKVFYYWCHNKTYLIKVVENAFLTISYSFFCRPKFFRPMGVIPVFRPVDKAYSFYNIHVRHFTFGQCIVYIVSNKA